MCDLLLFILFGNIIPLPLRFYSKNTMSINIDIINIFRKKSIRKNPRSSHHYVIPSKVFFISIGEFVDAGVIPHQAFFFKKISHSFFYTSLVMKPLFSQEVMYARKCVKIGGCEVWTVCYMIEYIPTKTLLLILGHYCWGPSHHYFSSNGIIFNQLQ